jgi:integrase
MMPMAKQKWRNRILERGVVIDRLRGYAYVRFKTNGAVHKELIGRVDDPDVIDRANFRAQQIRQQRRAEIPGFDARKQRMLLADAADLFLELHGKKRESKKGIKQFERHVRLWKEFWSGRYLDTMTPSDMSDYRRWRKIPRTYLINKKKIVSAANDSTINREQTALVTLFNKLQEWRKIGQIPKNTLLPEDNPGRGKDPGQKKVNEDRFVRDRLLTDEEFKSLWASSDGRTRRIILAEMNLPLRLEDLKRLNKKNINYRLSQFKGVQVKTGKEYTLPINGTLWELIKTAPDGQILDFSGFEGRWKRVVRRAGLKGLQFRDLRRTAATALHDNGVPLKTISVMLGHIALTTTIRYLGLKSENLKLAGDFLATKYCAPVENDRNRIQSVPQSVPHHSKIESPRFANIADK